MRATQDKRRSGRGGEGGVGGGGRGGGSLFLDETQSYGFSSAALFYSLLSYPNQPAVGSGEVSVFNATFSKSSIDTVWCQLKVTKSLMLPDALVVAALLQKSMGVGAVKGGQGANEWLGWQDVCQASICFITPPPPTPPYFIALR